VGKRPKGNPIPGKLGDPSPINIVFTSSKKTGRTIRFSEI